MNMKNYQSFQRASWTSHLWLNIIIDTLICSIVFYGMNLLLIWLLSEESVSSSHPLTDSVLLAAFFALLHCVQWTRIYHKQGKLNLLNLFSIPFCINIPISSIAIIMVFTHRKTRYNVVIVTTSGKTYKLSVADYAQFTEKLSQCNPKIIAYKFN